MLPPNQINRTPPPSERERSDGGGFLDFACSADLLHGHKLSVMEKHIPPTKKLPDSGDPVGIASRKITSADRPFGWCGVFHRRRK